MDYKAAYIKLYGASGAAIEAMYKVFLVTPELDKAIGILKTAIEEVEVGIDKCSDCDWDEAKG